MFRSVLLSLAFILFFCHDAYSVGVLSEAQALDVAHRTSVYPNGTLILLDKRKVGDEFFFEFKGHFEFVRVRERDGAVTEYENYGSKLSTVRSSIDSINSTAHAFLSRVLEKNLLPRMRKMDERELDRGIEKVHVFEFQENKGGILLPLKIRVIVNPFGATLRGYVRSEGRVIYPLGTPLITKEAALKSVLDEIRNKNPNVHIIKSEMMFELGGIDEAKKRNLRFWNFNLIGILSKGSFSGNSKIVTYNWMGRIDDSDGSINYDVRSLIGEKTSVKEKGDKVVFYDIWPSWSKSDSGALYFSTNRSLKPNNRDGRDLLSPAKISDGRITVLIVPEGHLIDSEVSRDESKIVLNFSNEVWLLNIIDSTLGRLNDPERVDRGQARWDFTGKLLISTGSNSPADLNAKGNAFIAKISEPMSLFSMKDNFSPIPFSGTVNSPSFSPDGKWIAFSFLDVSSSEAQTRTFSTPVYSLCVVPVPIRGGRPSHPIVIQGKLPSIDRLSWFPDSRRILVSYSQNNGDSSKVAMPLRATQIFDRISHSVITIKRPELSFGRVTKVRLDIGEGAVSPSGNRIAFSSFVPASQIDPAAYCVFTCGIDGGNLTRITQSHDQDLRFYKFSLPEVDALNAWNKLKPPF